MYRELTNLLPSERSRAFRREYFLRLGTVALLVLSALVVLHGVLLAPSYLYLKEQHAAKEAQLAQLEGALESGADQEVGVRLAKLEANIANLKRLSTGASASAAVRGVLDVPRTGIALSGMAFTASGTGGANTLTLTGSAATRTALREYVRLLEALPQVEKADLPISTYAKETELPFSITLTGTLTP